MILPRCHEQECVSFVGEARQSEYTMWSMVCEMIRPQASQDMHTSASAGEPKAIPWTHVTPVRCGVDAWAHLDLKEGAVLAWPTNLGWMMGPWLVFASLLNRATMALFQVCPFWSQPAPAGQHRA